MRPVVTLEESYNILSKRTVAALAVSLGLLGFPGFAGQSRAATDNNNVVQALRAGGSGHW
jgi:hypothetical protein